MHRELLLRTVETRIIAHNVCQHWERCYSLGTCGSDSTTNCTSWVYWMYSQLHAWWVSSNGMDTSSVGTWECGCTENCLVGSLVGVLFSGVHWIPSRLNVIDINMRASCQYLRAWLYTGLHLRNVVWILVIASYTQWIHKVLAQPFQ